MLLYKLIRHHEIDELNLKVCVYCYYNEFLEPNLSELQFYITKILLKKNMWSLFVH
jgi:hypothetical protein